MLVRVVGLELDWVVKVTSASWEGVRMIVSTSEVSVITLICVLGIIMFRSVRFKCYLW